MGCDWSFKFEYSLNELVFYVSSQKIGKYGCLINVKVNSGLLILAFLINQDIRSNYLSGLTFTIYG